VIIAKDVRDYGYNQDVLKFCAGESVIFILNNPPPNA